MEGMNKAALEAHLTFCAAQLRQQEEASRLRAEKERVRKEAEQRRLREDQETSQREMRAAVFDLLKDKSLNSTIPIAISSHYHDSDDGIGHSEDNKWTFVRDGEAIIVSKESERDDFGWSGSRKSQSSSVWLFASDIDRPLIARNKGVNVLRYGFPVDLQSFEPGSWVELKNELGELKETVQRKAMLDCSEELLGKYGVHDRRGFTADGQRIRDEAAIDRVVLQAPGDNQSIWRLIRKNNPFNGELESYVMDYSNLTAKDGFQIDLSPNNSRPYIWMPIHASHGSYGDVYSRHLELFQQGLKAIEQAVNPKLFDLDH